MSVAPTGRDRHGKTLLFLLTFLMFLLGALPVFAATPAGTLIENTAAATIGADGQMMIPSNTVRIVSVVRPRTPATLTFLKYAPVLTTSEPIAVHPTAYGNGSLPDTVFELLAAPVQIPSGEPINLGQSLPLATAAIFHRGEPVFLRLADPDQNVDPTVAETVLVTLTASITGDAEILRLTETGPNTGIFTGYIQSTATPGTPYDGRLEVSEAGTVEARYVDVYDGSDIATAATLFDPFGIVFDSRTGLPVNGAQITLIDAASGQPATVYGDDGVSLYPTTLTTGGTATDSSGALYNFRPGAYRFPFVAPGNYRLLIIAPAGYAAPSTVANADLQNLPGAPYALVTGSRGEVFQLNPGPALRIDIPVDSVALDGVWLRKTAGKDRVAIGDFVPYRIEIEIPGKAPTATATLTDRLPVGFRYRSGSARLNGERITDPAVSADGRTLSFALEALPAAGRSELRYVAEVTAGARPGEAINTAELVTTAGVVSNTAKATVQVRDDFFRANTFLMGRVFTGGCGEPGPEEPDGLPGARIYLEDGTYVVSDENGMFHFEGIRPGTHVVQLDLDSLPEWYEAVPCEANSRFSGRAYSQFVDLQGGSMWRTDFHVGLKPRARGEVAIELTSALEGDAATFRVPVRVGGVAVSNLRLSIILPEGMRYRQGSSTLSGDGIADPAAGFGGVLTYNLGDQAAGQKLEIAFASDISPTATADLTTRTLLTFDTPQGKNQRTPVAENLLQISTLQSRTPMPEFTLRPHFPTLGAELSLQDKAELDQLADKLRDLDVLRIHVVGHTDDVPIGPVNRHIFADNLALSMARAKSVGRYLADALNLPPAKIELSGLGELSPLAANGTPEGRALNRRVEVRIQSEKILEQQTLAMIKDRSGEQKTDTTGLRPGEGSPANQAAGVEAAADRMPTIDKSWVEKAEPGLEWLWPQPGYGPSIPSIKAAIKHNPKDKVELLLNGKPVHLLSFEGTQVNRTGTVAVSLWRGIGIQDGDNQMELIVRNGAGEIIHRQQQVVHYSGAPVKVVLAPDQSTLVADGKNPAVIAVRLTDKDGYPARAGVVGDFSVDSPYTAWERKESVARNVEAQEQGFRPKFQVGADGVAQILLEPTTRSGEVVLRFKLDDREQEIRAWLQPQLRDWILVGLAEGTVGYNSISGNMENLPSGVDEDIYDDGRVAFFGKGRVLGKWLLTLAYDSDKPDRKEKELFQIIDPDTYYTLYGDASQQAYEAASAEKLYVKLEREQFYALFGDYDTGLTQTELSRYSRSLTGFKAEFNGRYATLNVFASDTGQNFVKDELRGDGTSGLYRLSRGDIVLNSEKVTIEVRDRFHSEIILSSQELTRHLDYNIDYGAGTLFFKQPIPSRDETFNPVYIVVDYEARGEGETSLNYGGRGALRWAAKGLELGATAIHDELDNARGDLYGLDATWDLTEQTRLRAEVATSDTKAPGVSRNGNAWLAELEHRSGQIDGRLYIRELETGFGLGQQRGSEESTRKFGLDGTYKLSSALRLEGEIYRQENLESDAVRDVAQAALTYESKRYSLSSGLRYAIDEFADGRKEQSTQALFGGTLQATDRLLLRLAHEQSLAGNNDSGDFPTRTMLGADYKLTQATTLFVAQEFTRGDDTETQNTRIGFKTTPWTGGSLGSSLEQQTGEHGARMFALFGLNQSWQICERWSLDGSFDRSHTVREADAERFDTDVPPASGDTEDFTAVSLGATYKLAKWSWANRLEYRDGENEDKWGLFSALVGEVREGLGLSARAQLFTTESDTAEKTDGELRLGLAYRPFASRWIVLDRLDFIFEESESDDFSYDSWRLVNNLNANYKPNRRTQVSLQYGAKYVRETIDGDDYSGFTDLYGLEGRYDLTERWDVGVRGSILHSWRSELFDYSSGVSIGCNLVQNVWISAGYNFIGFQDEDFSRADFTAQGPFVKFRLKFDQNSVKDLLRQI